MKNKIKVAPFAHLLFTHLIGDNQDMLADPVSIRFNPNMGGGALAMVVPVNNITLNEDDIVGNRLIVSCRPSRSLRDVLSLLPTRKCMTMEFDYDDYDLTLKRDSPDVEYILDRTDSNLRHIITTLAIWAIVHELKVSLPTSSEETMGVVSTRVSKIIMATSNLINRMEGGAISTEGALNAWTHVRPRWNSMYPLILRMWKYINTREVDGREQELRKLTIKVLGSLKPQQTVINNLIEGCML